MPGSWVGFTLCTSNLPWSNAKSSSSEKQQFQQIYHTDKWTMNKLANKLKIIMGLRNSFRNFLFLSFMFKIKIAHSRWRTPRAVPADECLLLLSETIKLYIVFILIALTQFDYNLHYFYEHAIYSFLNSSTLYAMLRQWLLAQWLTSNSI